MPMLSSGSHWMCSAAVVLRIGMLPELLIGTAVCDPIELAFLVKSVPKACE